MMAGFIAEWEPKLGVKIVVSQVSLPTEHSTSLYSSPAMIWLGRLIGTMPVGASKVSWEQKLQLL